MRNWFRMETAAETPSIADIHIIDFIGDWIDDYWGFGVTAKAFVDQLSKLADSVKGIRVHINSPGGDVFAALNIANALRDQVASKGRTVETIVDGLAASAASVVMMAGGTIRVSDNALVMVHNPWSWGVGNAKDMRKLADDLDVVRNTIIATYRWHSQLDEQALGALMDAETWMSADDAIANGFATEKVEGLKAAASIDRRAIATLKVPASLRARVDTFVRQEPAAPTAAAAADVLRLCREGECLDVAEALVAEGATLEAVQARVAETKVQRTAAKTRTDQIRALCATHKFPELADGYVAGSMTLEAIKAHLTTLTAKLDRVEIDGGLPPGQERGHRAGLNPAAIYAARNTPPTRKE